jgi:two-component sensor histidine kinase
MKALVGFPSSREGALQRTFRHIGSKHAWSWQLLFFTLYVLSVISFLTDSVLAQSFDPRWFLVNFLAFLSPIAIALAYRFLFLTALPDASRPILNLAVAGIAGSSRNVSVGVFANVLDIDVAQLWLFRVIGGMVIGIAIFLLWSIVQGTSSDYKSSLIRLSQIQTELSDARGEMPELLQEVNENLQSRTRSAVLPQLEEINRALGESRSSELAVQQLRETLENQVRPLMDEISANTPAPFPQRNIERLAKSRVELPTKFNVYEALPILGSSLAQSMGYGFWLTLLYGAAGAIQSLQAIIIFALTLFIARFFVPRDREYPRLVGATLVIVIAAIASSATVLYLATLSLPMIEFVAIAGLSVFGGILAPILNALNAARQKRRAEIEARISIDLLEIAKQNSFFAQRVWVFRRRWLLVLHGTVQSALTAAVNRLSNAKEVDEFTVQMVNQDLLRATSAIDSNQSNSLNLEESFKELHDVWSGICSVNVKISERAKRALTRNSDTAFCVNEIAKEAVSNAVRHGSAKSALIEIDRLEDDLLQVEITNDGIPLRSQEKPGIGSEMLDEICLNWALENSGKKVRLTANLPVRA